ncbi:MAG TPA: RNA-processing protein, partial [Euryarchaeota archaeon]|nr:RNA-processing protein [Euryarchaeota archaeon]
MRHLNIPKDRVGILIGPEGTIKRRIEDQCSCKIRIESETGGVSIDDSKDPYMGMKASDIVKAIGRGFSPENAFRLFSDDVYFFLFDIRDFAGKNRNRLKELRGRLIGTDGRMRYNIE